MQQMTFVEQSMFVIAKCVLREGRVPSVDC